MDLESQEKKREGKQGLMQGQTEYRGTKTAEGWNGDCGEGKGGSFKILKS